MEALLDRLDAARTQSVTLFARPEIGLRAALVIDDTTLGPAAGGIRTRRYPAAIDGLDDACRLARAMTLKCSIAGLDAGGGKLVILDNDELDRPAAFRYLGDRVEELGGTFLTAGDLGTTADDLRQMAGRTRWVRTDEPDLAGSVARGLLGCVRACSEVAGRADDGLRIAIQGCGAIGEAVARTLAGAGADLLVADLHEPSARRVAEATGAKVVDPAEVLTAEVDIIAPCAAGGVITAEIAEQIAAWAVCGAANNIVADDRATERLHARGILLVPDFIASAGAVIHGICEFGGSDDRDRLVDGLADTTRRVLEESRARDTPTPRVAHDLARRRIEARA